jgi:hypothetical protein
MNPPVFIRTKPFSAAGKPRISISVKNQQTQMNEKLLAYFGERDRSSRSS